MTMHSNGLTKLLEEAGEVVQAAAKLMAFPQNDHPSGVNLFRQLEDEMADLNAAMLFVAQPNQLPQLNKDRIARRSKAKLQLFNDWDKYGITPEEADKAYMTYLHTMASEPFPEVHEKSHGSHFWKQPADGVKVDGKLDGQWTVKTNAVAPLMTMTTQEGQTYALNEQESLFAGLILHCGDKTLTDAMYSMFWRRLEDMAKADDLRKATLAEMERKIVEWKAAADSSCRLAEARNNDAAMWRTKAKNEECKVRAANHEAAKLKENLEVMRGELEQVKAVAALDHERKVEAMMLLGKAERDNAKKFSDCCLLQNALNEKDQKLMEAEMMLGEERGKMMKVNNELRDTITKMHNISANHAATLKVLEATQDARDESQKAFKRKCEDIEVIKKSLADAHQNVADLKALNARALVDLRECQTKRREAREELDDTKKALDRLQAQNWRAANVLDWLGTRSDARLQEYRFRRHDDMEMYSIVDEDSSAVYGKSFLACLQELAAISRTHDLPAWAKSANS